MRNVLPLFGSEGSSPRLSAFQSAGSPSHGIRHFHLLAYCILDFAAGNIHHQFSQLVQITRSLRHVSSISHPQYPAQGLWISN
jgi:hypothetical protein